MIYRSFLRPVVAAILCLTLLTFETLNAQVQTARPNTSMGPNTNGYYEYLPAGYDGKGNNGNGVGNGNKPAFPLLIFVHGVGELGNGSSSLRDVLRNGPPKVIDQGLFPSSFTVNGQKLSFIVISPQFKDWPSPDDIDKVINYCLKNYNVDQSRIYLTGLSMGGGVVWSYVGSNAKYANKIAAIVPISGAAGADVGEANIIAATNMGVWGLHNSNDDIVPSYYTVNWINYINASPSHPNPPAKKTIFNQGGHDAWTPVYNMSYTENGMNIYQWMLQFQKGGNFAPAGPTNTPPVANAGGDQTITLPLNTVQLNGTGSTDADGTISSYKWTQSAGPSNVSFSNNAVANPTVNNLQVGTYTFSLLVTDNQGATSLDNVNIIVNPAPVSFVNGGMKIEAENYSAANGIMVQSSQDADGSPAVGGINTGSWMDYNNISIPASGNYTLSVRVATPYTGQLQLINPNGNVAGTINITSTGGWQKWATVTGTVNLTAGNQKLRVYSSNGSWNINWLQLTTIAATPPPPPPPPPPVNTGTSTRIEAETYSAGSHIMTQPTADAGGGLNVGGITTGSWMDYQINIPSAGTYTFNARIATPNSGDQLQILNSNGSTLTTLSIPSTGAWQSWVTITGTVNLAAGNQKLRILSSSGSWNFNWFELIGGAVSSGGNGSNTSDACTKAYKIVVLGSSTAYGSGATPIDSSWVNKFTTYVKSKNAQSSVINLGGLGYTTYEVLRPTGSTPPPSRPAPDVTHNITAAINLHPDAIIINLPSNDIGYGFTLAEQESNYETAISLAKAAGIPVWVSTTQPRTNLNAGEKQNLMTLRDWTYTRFGGHAIDFWTTIANPDGSINAAYSFGDNIHVNNAGHQILYTRVLAEHILDSLCKGAGGSSTPIITDNKTHFIKVQVYSGSNAITDAQWNAWNVGSGAANNVSSGPLKYSNGTVSSISSVLSTTESVGDNGSNYGSTSVTMAPNSVLRYTSYSNVARTLSINGLIAGKKYDIELYSSRYSNGNNTVFTVNGNSVTIPTFENYSNKAKFTSISPNAQGQIIIGLDKVGNYNYLNGFTLIEQGTDYATATAGLNAIQSLTTKPLIAESNAPLSVFPNPFTDRFTAQVNNQLTGQVKIQVIDMNGSVKKQFQAIKDIPQPTQIYLSAGELSSGIYLIRVQMDGWINTQKVVKQ